MDLLSTDEAIGSLYNSLDETKCCNHSNSKDHSMVDADTLLQLNYFVAKHFKNGLCEEFYHDSQTRWSIIYRENRAVTTVRSSIPKSLSYEWPKAFLKTIDISCDIASDDATAIIAHECSKETAADKEVAYKDLNSRSVLSLDAKATIENDDFETPDENSVFIVTGGARGIASDCVKEMARNFSCRFVLLGRTDIYQEEPEWAKNQISKSDLMASLNSFDSALKPNDISYKVEKLLNLREARTNIEEIKELGSDIAYYSCDVTDVSTLNKTIVSAKEKFGKIDGLIHAAGNLADKKIEDKKLEDYEKVVEVKVDGLRNLIVNLDMDKIKYCILFSSVSGFYGNRGQVDYSMANEILNKYAYK